MKYNFSRYWFVPYLAVLVASCILGMFLGWFYYDDAILRYFFVFTVISAFYAFKFVKDVYFKVYAMLFSVLAFCILSLYLLYYEFYQDSVLLFIFLLLVCLLAVYLVMACIVDEAPFLENSVAMTGVLIIAMIIVVNIGSLSPFRVTFLTKDAYFDSKVITVPRNNVIFENDYLLVKNDDKVEKFVFKHVNQGADKTVFADKDHKSGTKSLEMEVRTFSLKNFLVENKDKVGDSQLKRFIFLSKSNPKLQGKPFVYKVTEIKYQ